MTATLIPVPAGAVEFYGTIEDGGAESRAFSIGAGAGMRYFYV